VDLDFDDHRSGGRGAGCGPGAAPREMKEGFFFEKKKQKTFCPFAAATTSRWATYASWQKFFVLFFKKEHIFCPG
jgi:hypothetical protein